MTLRKDEWEMEGAERGGQKAAHGDQESKSDKLNQRYQTEQKVMHNIREKKKRVLIFCQGNMFWHDFTRLFFLLYFFFHGRVQTWHGWACYTLLIMVSPSVYTVKFDGYTHTVVETLKHMHLTTLHLMYYHTEVELACCLLRMEEKERFPWIYCFSSPPSPQMTTSHQPSHI